MFPTSTSKLKPWYVLVALGLLLVGAVFWYVSRDDEIIEELIIEEEVLVVPNSVIGQSVEGRDIETYVYGDGPIDVLFVGGVHGGYEWNSVVLAYEFIDYLEQLDDGTFDTFTVHVIPDLNPDGVYAATGLEGRFAAADVSEIKGPAGTGRFNANGVDLNRNFACKWQPESKWRGQTVSAGSAAFSEPEAATLRDYVSTVNPVAVVFWHSQANAVYASECHDGVLTDTLGIMSAYATAADYNAVESFDAYPVSGDAEGWLASIGIPAITVELSSHEAIEWQRNLAGIKALFAYYTETVFLK